MWFPEEVILRIAGMFELPEPGEGFDEVITRPGLMGPTAGVTL